MTEIVHYDLTDGVATITLDSQHNRNAMSQRLLTELADRLEGAIADRGVRVAVLAAEGPAFCAGADLKERSAPGTEDGDLGTQAAIPTVMERIMSCDLPVVARVHGAVRAGGNGLVAACDIAIAHSSVTFSVPEVHLGLIPAVISVPIERMMDRRSFHRYFLTGEPFDAAEAARIGLITEATDDLDGTIEGILAHFRKAHPGALRRTKQLLQQVGQLDAASAFQITGEVSARWFATPDGQEGMRAVLEKREPSWR